MATRRPRATAASLLLLLSASSASSPSTEAAAAFLRPLRSSIPFQQPPAAAAVAAARRHLCSRSPNNTNSNTNMAAAPESAGLADIGAQGPTTRPQPQLTVASSTSGGGDNTKPQWLQQLERALQRNGKDAHSRYVQLATVGEEEGFVRPFVRTVVYRGVFQLEGRACLKMITDARSEKVGHLATYPHAEVAWYFTKSREQFRVFGTIQVVTHADSDKALQGQRRHQWGCLSDNAKIQFLWPHPKHPFPGRDAKPATELDALFNPPIPEAAHKTPPDTFCLMLFRPARIDHLELKTSPQRRTLHVFQEGVWAVEPVNP